ncbi:hypothetical protein [Microbacterium sp. MYb66]|jgi:hypothetical protein|uniref:hypothetical protein n=1 Tax=Microbacterium sp. MYb66 TaxID=1848692 RepID=UPI000D010CC0|nr:hypothetical protein [Microbacterium sp. MYb66]PRA79994.1 hypothetical protein CQ045_13105 [Microbacterium sp. MYb66]
MSTPFPPVPPLPADDDADAVPTRDVDGERVLDPDIDDDAVDSAEADRLAAEVGDPDDDTTT